MPDRDPGEGGDSVVFNINTQNADVINVAGRDQYNQINTGTARDLVQQLRDAVDEAELPPQVAPEVRTQLNEVTQELAKPAPEGSAVAKRLARVAELLMSVGAVVGAATPLGAPLFALTRVLGHWSEPLRRQLKK